MGSPDRTSMAVSVPPVPPEGLLNGETASLPPVPPGSNGRGDDTETDEEQLRPTLSEASSPGVHLEGVGEELHL